MAANDTQDVKRRIKSITSMEHITNAMRLVASSKLRKTRQKYEKTRKNFAFVEETIKDIVNNAGKVPGDYMEGSREIKRVLYILITGNRGLCGSFNVNLTRTCKKMLEEEEGEALAIAIGQKAVDFLRKQEVQVVREYFTPPESVTYQAVQAAAKPILEAYENDEIDKVVIISTRFINALQQRVSVEQILPFRHEKDPEGQIYKREVDYEPSLEEVFNYLVPKHMEISLYGAVMESGICEHAARRMAMENATDAASEMLDDLTLTYNRARQATITEEIIEIVSGAQAQNS